MERDLIGFHVSHLPKRLQNLDSSTKEQIQEFKKIIAKCKFEILILPTQEV